ncbi:hypothetical protein LY01_02512 [Nonlabens xylanidelens]|uniref:Lipoprotein n=1 Tax=Nonlabens xylanidelens TaxID=191564 RepID=A0A2S6IGB4_9FLAO|nr:hypothetical protein [Nonlabens xylanidelens]PPK93227.1 hypothetical protein LY01_02512 [Nonlabens xylanidelens]PQJ20948.1 hypothetical protein BST94_05525 [Nonlabens xylanidelens]
MKKTIIYLLFTVLIISCSSLKETETALNQGNYDQAIDIAVNKLIEGKTAKRNQEYIPLLKQAYMKAVAQDQILLQRWQLDNNPAVLESIYETYVGMDQRQDKIKPLLPLTLIKENETVDFDFENYNANIIASKNDLSDYLLINSKTALRTANTIEARSVYNDLIYLEKINPNFKDTRDLMKKALEKGTHYIMVNLKNQSQTVLPQLLEEELLNFSTYGINDQWTQYHNNEIVELDYDYDIDIIIDRIVMSPEQVSKKELHKERLVQDGYIYEYDANGNVKKDSLGNDIKRDKFVTIKASVVQNTQFKESNVNAVVQLIDNRTSQTVDRFPVASNFIFTYIYGSVYGDRRALDANYLETLNPRSVNFPTDEQMIYDTGEDLKYKIKQILNNLNYN